MPTLSLWQPSVASPSVAQSTVPYPADSELPVGLTEDPVSRDGAVTGSFPAARVPEPSTSGAPGDLAVAYTELQDRLLESTDVTAFLEQVAVLCAAAVPAAGCGITMRGDRSAFTVASSNELATEVDEIQYGRGQGPCLQTLHTGLTVAVPDLMTDERWPEYRTHALARGIRSSLSLPLTSGSHGGGGSVASSGAVAALNLYGLAPHQFGPDEAGRANAFARHSSAALTIMVRHSEQLTLESQLREALASRAVIDQGDRHHHGAAAMHSLGGIRRPPRGLSAAQRQTQLDRLGAHREDLGRAAPTSAAFHPARLMPSVRNTFGDDAEPTRS